MPSTLEIVLVIIEILEVTAGVWGNGFIMLATCAEWIKTKTISVFDFALLCLSGSRVAVMGATLEDSLERVFYSGLSERHLVVRIIIDGFWNVGNSLGMWCSVCFSFLYFLKLFHFSHPVFLWLKCRQEKTACSFLLGFFLSLLLHLLSISCLTFGISDQLDVGRNLTWKSQYTMHRVFLHLGLLIPLLVMLLSFSLLAFSLWRHMKRMRDHTRASRDPSAEVCATARHPVLYFIFILAVHYLDTVLITWSSFTTDTSVSVIVTETLVLFYPSLHPFFLIRGNRKLRQTSVNLLRAVVSCLGRM